MELTGSGYRLTATDQGEGKFVIGGSTTPPIDKIPPNIANVGEGESRC